MHRCPRGRADPRLLLGLAWLAGFTLIDASIVSLALPDIARDFDRSVGELAWVATGYLLALAATLLAAGRLNDRYGSRVVLGLGGVAFLVFTPPRPRLAIAPDRGRHAGRGAVARRASVIGPGEIVDSRRRPRRISGVDLRQRMAHHRAAASCIGGRP